MSGSWFDQSYEIFLPGAMKSAAGSYQQYPLFWWNFAVVEKDTNAGAVAEKLCAGLPCPDFQPLAKAWLADSAVRRDYPGAAELAQQAQATMAKAALPMPREMTELLRLDPLNEIAQLQARMDARLNGFTREGQWLRDQDSGRALIPVKFDFPPNESLKTVPFHAKSRDLGATLLGSHAGTMENEMRIRADVGTVSTVGTISLVLLIGLIVFWRRSGLLWLLPLLAVSTAAAAALTVAVFGSIHAISLSFGPGLIGLAMDFGIHAAFLDPRSRVTWRSNFMALLTSLVIMILLGFSAIPLLKQMMFFAVTGLVLSYALFYLCMTRWPRRFAVTPLKLAPKPSVPLSVFSLILAAGALTLFFQPLRLDLDQLNYETKTTRELRLWFFERTGAESSYHLPEQAGLLAWARGNGIGYDGPSLLLPEAAEQKRHLETWREPCRRGLFTGEAKKFFAPFEQAVCANLEPRTLEQAPPYVRDFTNGRDWIAVLKPATAEHGKLIQAQYPAAHSPRELLKQFPATFAAELKWMLPVALIGALLFLMVYYRGIFPALAACLPFAAGVGCFSMMTLLLGLPVTFISLMGLLMVFGFSIDYGIFAVDSRARSASEQNGVWSALALCAVSTLAGFAPMAMGHHPVLQSLGHSLLWGSAGTYLGAFWGVPALYRWLR